MDKKRERSIRAMINKVGLICESMRVTGGNHISATLRNSASAIRHTVIFSGTPSDGRGELNRMAQLRRIAREVPQ